LFHGCQSVGKGKTKFGNFPFSIFGWSAMIQKTNSSRKWLSPNYQDRFFVLFGH